MLVVALPGGADAPRAAGVSATNGASTVFSLSVAIGTVGVAGATNELASFANFTAHTNLAPRARWRASKGSAPVGRFTRAIADNTTEGWHRSMPVGIEVTAGTTATVAAMFILGATSTAEARATAATVGAFVLGVAAIAQARATATTTGTLAAGVVSVAQARATASTTGTLTLGASSIAQALAQANAVATFVLGITATATVGVAAVIGPGLILGDLTWVARFRGALTHRTRHQGDATYQPRHDADLTQRVRHDGDTTYKTRD